MDITWTKSPSRDTTISVANGQEVDPRLVSLKSLVRVGEAEYQACLLWLTAERKTRAAAQAAKEAMLEADAARIRTDAEEHHAARESYLEANPWERAPR